MPRYRIAITAQVPAPAVFNAAVLRALTDADVTELSPDILRIVMVRAGRDANCAAIRCIIDIHRALAPAVFTRPPVWTSRQLGLLGLGFLGLGRRSSGRISLGGDDDGLSGVREPRRPLPSAGSASVALDLPGI